MTEKEIQLLGFERHSDNGDEYWDTYHYYTYEIAIGLEFISNASDEVKEDGEWFVEVFNTEPNIRFYKFEEVQTLINTLNKHLITES